MKSHRVAPLHRHTPLVLESGAEAVNSTRQRLAPVRELATETRHVALCGTQFNTDGDAIKPASDATLGEIAKLQTQRTVCGSTS